MTLGTPLARLPAAGCHVPVDRRQRMGESAVNFSRHDAARGMKSQLRDARIVP
jgi:hypothetical protein